MTLKNLRSAQSVNHIDGPLCRTDPTLVQFLFWGLCGCSQRKPSKVSTSQGKGHLSAKSNTILHLYKGLVSEANVFRSGHSLPDSHVGLSFLKVLLSPPLSAATCNPNYNLCLCLQ